MAQPHFTIIFVSKLVSNVRKKFCAIPWHQKLTMRTFVVYKFREERQFLRVSGKYRKRGEKHETSKVQVHYLATPILECYSVQSIGQFGEMKKKVDPEKAATKVVNFFLTKIVALCGYFILHSLFLCRKPFKAQWGQSLYENVYR